MVETINKIQCEDNRIFAEIVVKGKSMKGLLDTGASVNLLGENCRELVEELNLDIQKHYSSVKTAGGENFYIVGKIKLAVIYKNIVNDIVFYLCPYLQYLVETSGVLLN